MASAPRRRPPATGIARAPVSQPACSPLARSYGSAVTLLQRAAGASPPPGRGGRSRASGRRRPHVLVASPTKLELGHRGDAALRRPTSGSGCAGSASGVRSAGPSDPCCAAWAGIPIERRVGGRGVVAPRRRCSATARPCAGHCSQRHAERARLLAFGLHHIARAADVPWCSPSSTGGAARRHRAHRRPHRGCRRGRWTCIRAVLRGHGRLRYPEQTSCVRLREEDRAG